MMTRDRRTPITLLLCAALTLLAACGGQGAAQAPSEAVPSSVSPASSAPASSEVAPPASQATESDIVERLFAANDYRASTLKTHRQIRVERRIVDADGAQIGSHILTVAAEQDGYAMLEETYDPEADWEEVRYLLGNYVYGRNSDGPYVACLFDDQLEEELEEVQMGIYSPASLDPTVEWPISQQERDGVLTVVNGANLEKLGQFFWQDDLDGFSGMEYVYECDAETLELLTQKAYITAEDGRRRLMDDFTFTYSDQPLVPPDFVAELLHPAKTRTILIHLDSGESRTFTVPREVRAALSNPEGYDFYADAQGKTPLFSTTPKPGNDIEAWLLKSN